MSTEKGRKAVELMDKLEDAWYSEPPDSITFLLREWRLFKEDQAITERIANKRKNITDRNPASKIAK